MVVSDEVRRGGRLNNQAGFTVLELVVVVIAITMLALIVLFVLQR